MNERQDGGFMQIPLWMTIVVGALLLSGAFLFLFLSQVEAKSGCCSWHSGVSYCDTNIGRYVCNDGTYSPSCTCTYIPPKPTKAELIRNEIEKTKAEYYKNPHWFREKLIDNLTLKFQDRNLVAASIYSILKDVK